VIFSQPLDAQLEKVSVFTVAMPVVEFVTEPVSFDSQVSVRSEVPLLPVFVSVQAEVLATSELVDPVLL
jgi:hypothetical protein